MGKTIDADSLIEHARRRQLKYSDEKTRQTAWWFIHKYLPDLVAKEPTVDVVVHGEWIDCSNGNATCSVCRTRQHDVYDDDNEQRFCGACGADLRR